jgi:outer membrane protein assembly factor BamB
MTGAARIHCVEAADGTPAWVADIGARSLTLAWDMELLRQTGDMRGYSRCLEFNGAIAGGVLAVPDGRLDGGRMSGDEYGYDGLTGLDIATGLPRWYAPRAGGRPLVRFFPYEGGTPTVWRQDGRDFFVTNARCVIHCIDARSGERVWQDSGYHYYGQSRVFGGLILARNGHHNMNGRRLTATGAEELWKTNGQPSFHGMVKVGGYVYNYGRRESVPTGTPKVKLDNLLYSIDLATGRHAATLRLEGVCHIGGTDMTSYGLVGAGDLLFLTNWEGLYVVKTDAHGGLELLGNLNLPIASGNGLSITPAIVDGILYVRCQRRLRAYDLRRGAGDRLPTPVGQAGQGGGR